MEKKEVKDLEKVSAISNADGFVIYSDTLKKPVLLPWSAMPLVSSSNNGLFNSNEFSRVVGYKIIAGSGKATLKYYRIAKSSHVAGNYSSIQITYKALGGSCLPVNLILNINTHLIHTTIGQYKYQLLVGNKTHAPIILAKREGDYSCYYIKCQTTYGFQFWLTGTKCILEDVTDGFDESSCTVLTID